MVSTNIKLVKLLKLNYTVYIKITFKIYLNIFLLLDFSFFSKLSILNPIKTEGTSTTSFSLILC